MSIGPMLKWKRIPPTTDLDHYIMSEMCLQAATGIELQCNREYWSDTNSEKRATAIHKLTAEERKNIPNNDLCCERYLSRFGYLASQSAAHLNKYFKGKRIRDDLMTLEEEENSKIDRRMISIMNQLDSMKISWTATQKIKKKENILENLLKKKRSNEFANSLLKKCKEQKGPVTSVEELKALVNENSHNLKPYLRVEVQYKRELHQRDAEVRSNLYKVNRLTVQDLIENLTILLSEHPDADESVIFPCEDEIMDLINGSSNSNPTDHKETTKSLPISALKVNQPVAVLWDMKSKKQWFIGSLLGTNADGTYRIDHLERVDSRSNRGWQRRSGNDDIQDADEIQILPVMVHGDWDFTHEKPSYLISNEREITENVNKIVELFHLNVDTVKSP